jgi:hypothetical protein
MYRPEVRHRALALIRGGHSLRSISMSMGINRSTLREWRDHPEKAERSGASCPRCAAVVALPEPCADYAYLLGLYLGDGCISRASDRNKFPQHGPGKKHTRKIELAEWQQVIVERYPGKFARGLMHSDGYRGLNRIRHTLEGGERWYEYPRYLFVNESTDILGLCGETLDRLGVEWRFSKPNTISVAKRDAVARLDQFVGPKH